MKVHELDPDYRVPVIATEVVFASGTFKPCLPPPVSRTDLFAAAVALTREAEAFHHAAGGTRVLDSHNVAVQAYRTARVTLYMPQRNAVELARWSMANADHYPKVDLPPTA